MLAVDGVYESRFEFTALEPDAIVLGGAIPNRAPMADYLMIVCLSAGDDLNGLQ